MKELKGAITDQPEEVQSRVIPVDCAPSRPLPLNLTTSNYLDDPLPGILPNDRIQCRRSRCGEEPHLPRQLTAYPLMKSPVDFQLRRLPSLDARPVILESPEFPAVNRKRHIQILEYSRVMRLREDGIEYFNTVVVQPHRKLVTNQGRGYHIRCKYQTQEKTVTNAFNVSFIGTTPLTATAPMPGCYMRIFAGTPEDKKVAENVRIGDPLTMEISLDDQEIYGMKVTDCLVRDGLGWGEQMLINEEGCPVDYEILGGFEYESSKTKAIVRFQAHKFPYTSSVYYQCNVKLCIKNAGGCDDVVSISLMNRLTCAVVGSRTVAEASDRRAVVGGS
ncbi:hypothetical protein C7M84_020546 [Penaeus vannamei]|uniref:ZP domain-containing protein n=1 Tax=Penaeus vannamei TaxID=6689 RepID=A0A3R7PCS9_PENVA|nr:hypothetical protein C7M84_020546 [Penaeus vannamei]